MRISLIVPVYNESQTLPLVLAKLSHIPDIDQIIVVDDGSTDKTHETLKTLKRLKRFERIILIRHTKNLGKGAAIRTALPQITQPLTLIHDADLEYDPRDITKLLLAYKGNTPPRAGANKIDSKGSRFKDQGSKNWTLDIGHWTLNNRVAVYGSRLLNNPFPHRGYLRTLIGNHAITAFTNLLHGTQLTDSYTCYKLIPTQTLRSLNLSSNRFEIEAEITAKLAKRKVKILEVPISYRPRTYAKGKKIKLKDFFLALWTIARLRFRVD